MTKDFDVISENPINVEEAGEGMNLSSFLIALQSKDEAYCNLCVS